ncbi:MAG: hypothetical protein JJT96_19650 [Opitutales bacterium]|nr:hypothetical protein [Opitutales bacterium]
MKKPLFLLLTGAVLALILAGWWFRDAGHGDERETRPLSLAPADAGLRDPVPSAPPSRETLEQTPDAPAHPTLFGHPPGLTLEEQNQRRERERIEDVPAEVIEHARTKGFPFSGVVVRVVEEHGFWLVAHDPVDAYMWAAENRPIHPEDRDRLEEFGPGDTLRGYIFHGPDGYLLRFP